MHLREEGQLEANVLAVVAAAAVGVRPPAQVRRVRAPHEDRLPGRRPGVEAAVAAAARVADVAAAAAAAAAGGRAGGVQPLAGLPLRLLRLEEEVGRV